MKVAGTLQADAGALVLGCRSFDRTQSEVPFRSRFGNRLTTWIVFVLTGIRVADTQTGLRGIPRQLMELMLKAGSTGYDFETDMLIAAVRHKFKLREVAIETIYLEGNKASHFNPVLDSLRIYYVFFRFSLTSIATAIIDMVVFTIGQYLGQNILLSVIAGRLVAGVFQFLASKRFVFRSSRSFWSELVKYVLLVAALMFVSNSAISVLVRRLGMNVYLAKLLAEALLFLASFAVQRLFVFGDPQRESLADATDWDAYYERPFRASSITRKITIRRILDCIRESRQMQPGAVFLELGGGNSCIYGDIKEHFQPGMYMIVDRNRSGLEKFGRTYSAAQHIQLIEDDVLALRPLPCRADVCISVGLIEHFSPEGTRRAVLAHFDNVAPDGLVVMTFPTPTWLYRLTRHLAEWLGMWKFPDERPCTMHEIQSIVEERGSVLHSSIIWPIVLTQGLIAAKPRP